MKDEKVFVLLDAKGNEVKPGDTIAVSRPCGNRSAYLSVALLREIKLCPKTVSLHFIDVSDDYESWGRIQLSYSESSKPSNQILKIEDIEFCMDQKRFAKLIAMKSEFEKE